MSGSDLAQRLGLRRKPRASNLAAQQASAASADSAGGQPQGPAGAPATAGATELRQRRDQLAKEFTELQWDLGGLAYEMASRDHFRLDVLVRQAARLQQVDAELAEAERILRLDEAGAAGACSSCGALFARGAVYCWQCGHDLMERREVTAAYGAAAQPVPAPQSGPAPAAPSHPPQPAAAPVPGEQQPATQVAPLPQQPPPTRQDPPDARVSFG
jgi:hypothetical protein